MHAAPLMDDALRRDVAILSTLAHLHCATVLQLHALCFPYHTLATARITLHYLAEAHFITRSPWRLKRESHERGQVWTLTAKGHDLLQRYIPHVPPLERIDLARPSTALEHEEWRVRLKVRTLLLRLLLEARRAPVLHCLDVQLPGSRAWPTAWSGLPQLEPDAMVSVVWHPAVRQRGDWLPWLNAEPLPADGTLYPIYIERTYTQVELAELLPAWEATLPTRLHIPVVVLQNEDRYPAASRHLAMLALARPIRLVTCEALDGDIVHELWREDQDVKYPVRQVLDESRPR